MDFDYKIKSIGTKEDFHGQKEIGYWFVIRLEDGKNKVEFTSDKYSDPSTRDIAVDILMDHLHISGFMQLEFINERFSIEFDNNNKPLSLTSNKGLVITKNKVTKSTAAKDSTPKKKVQVGV